MNCMLHMQQTRAYKIECPEKKVGNMANTGAARGRPVVMATQEIQYTSMAQVIPYKQPWYTKFSALP